MWKMSIKDFKKYKCDECGKNFTHNIGLKGHITAVHERKDSIVINVAKYNFESIYTNCSWERLWIQLWSLWQKFH